MLYIRCSTLLTPTRQLKNIVLRIENGKIISIDSRKPPKSAQVIDARGLIAAPGFIDWQINGGFGFDFTENPNSIWEVGQRLVAHGVTSFLPTIISSPEAVYPAAIEALKLPTPKNYLGAQPLGWHFEGPFLNPQKKGAHNPDHLRPPSLKETETWTRENNVWLVTLAPELNGADELIRFLRKKNVVVSIGHSTANYEEAEQAFTNGVTSATHLFNAMPKLDHREPGLVGALLNNKHIIVGLIPDGIHFHPEMINLAWKLKGKGGIAIVTDAISALGMPRGKYRVGDFYITSDGTSARLDDGTLAGSVLQMDISVKNMMAFTSCSLQDAIRTATLNVSRLIGAKNKGALRVGADADIVLLNENGDVQMTIVNGEVVYKK